MNHDDRRMAEFKQQTRLSDAREALLTATTSHNRIVRRPLAEADDRALVEGAVIPVDVPGYGRTAMDGYAVRASDALGASGRSPNVLRIVDGPVEPGTAAHVHTGSNVPEGANTVMIVEHTERLGDEFRVLDALAEDGDVGERDEDVHEGTPLFEASHEFRPSDIGLLRSVGIEEVTPFEHPRVSVVPTDEGLVESDPGPGEIIETNGLIISRLVEHWGSEASYRDIVVDDADLLRKAVGSDPDHNVVAATGGSSVGERDLTPEVVDDIGEVLVHGVTLKPDHPIAVGVIKGTPAVVSLGYPVVCVVNAFQFLQPVLKHVGSLLKRPLPAQEATLTRKLPNPPGIRTFTRVKLGPSGDKSTVEPTRTNGSGILSSVTLTDGWVVVPEEIKGYGKGNTIAVEGWE